MPAGRAPLTLISLRHRAGDLRRGRRVRARRCDRLRPPLGPPLEDVGEDRGKDEMTVTGGGRFDKGTPPGMVSFTRSIETDIRLLPYDVAATKAHARVLVGAGLLD